MNMPFAVPSLPQPRQLPKTLPMDSAIRLELQEGVPIFRASSKVQGRIEQILDKQRESGLTSEEERELDLYEEMDDYLSFVNRAIRNLLMSMQPQEVST